MGAPLAVATLAAAGAGLAKAPRHAPRAPTAPIDPKAAVSTHGPFEMGQCDICHDASRGAAPGRLLKAVNEICFDCHDDYRAAKKRHHPAVKGDCTQCHSPHNSRRKRLLR